MPCLEVVCCCCCCFVLAGIFVCLGIFCFVLGGREGLEFLPPLLSKLSAGQDSPSKLPFLSYSKSTDLATSILPPAIMIPQQTSMLSLEQYSRKTEKPCEAKNFLPFKSIEFALANKMVSRLQFV